MRTFRPVHKVPGGGTEGEECRHRLYLGLLVINISAICLLTCLKNARPNFLYLLPVAVLGPPLTAMRYITYFRFCR